MTKPPPKNNTIDDSVVVDADPSTVGVPSQAGEKIDQQTPPATSPTGGRRITPEEAFGSRRIEWEEAFKDDVEDVRAPQKTVTPIPEEELYRMQNLSDVWDAKLAKMREELMEPLVTLNEQINNQAQEVVNFVAAVSNTKNEWRSRVILAWIFFGLIAYVSVLAPLATSIKQGVQQTQQKVDRATEPIKALLGDIFAGDVISQTGIRFNTAHGVCEVTDTRRYRSDFNPPRAHNGIDIACGDSKAKSSKGEEHTGTFPFYAPVDAELKILQPAESNGGGLVARILFESKGKKYMIQIMHNLEITVPAGPIKAGTQLGIAGAPSGTPEAGTSTGPHTHIEIADVTQGDSAEQRVYQDVTQNLARAILGSKLPTDVAPPDPGAQPKPQPAEEAPSSPSGTAPSPNATPQPGNTTPTVPTSPQVPAIDPKNLRSADPTTITPSPSPSPTPQVPGATPSKPGVPMG